MAFKMAQYFSTIWRYEHAIRTSQDQIKLYIKTHLIDRDMARVIILKVLLGAVRNNGMKAIHKMHVVYVVKPM